MNFWESKRIRPRSAEPTHAEHFDQWNLDIERARALDFVWPPTSLADLTRWVEETTHQKLEGDRFLCSMQKPGYNS